MTTTTDLPEIPEISVTETWTQLQSGLCLFDVREEHEWEENRIEGAEWKPMSEIEEWWTDLPRDEQLVFYCRSGNRSGQVVAALIHDAGFDNVVNMAGGLMEWEEQELPLENS